MEHNATPSLSSQIDWDDLYPRLLLRAWQLTKGRPNQKQLAEEIVHEAILLSATSRPWNSLKWTYYQHIVWIMKSILHHQFTSAEARNTVGADESTIIQFPDIQPTAEQELLYQSQERHLLQYIGERNSEARILAMIILRFGYKTSKEIAKKMEVKPTRVDYLKRQLRVIVLDFINSEPDCSDSPALRIANKISGEA
jgi:DNA-directed RNA polymerase specialized sigma24 family protein